MANLVGRFSRPAGLALLASVLLFASGACTSATTSAPNPSVASGTVFPLTVHTADGDVRIASRPDAIVSLSPSATEMLYSIGAGPQVKAVDSYSDYPPQAPRTNLDEENPNVEQIASYHADLVVVGPGDSSSLNHQLRTLGIPVLYEPAASDVGDAYSQFEQLGAATGHAARARAEVSTIKAQIASIVRSTPKPAAGADTYYYELEQNYYSVTSSTFVGRLLGLLGLHDVADSAQGAASSGGYPQLSAEFIIKANPAYIFLADTVCCGQTAATVGARPGWSSLRAVRDGHVVGINDDIASRWGPRMVDLLRTVAAALEPRRAGT